MAEASWRVRSGGLAPICCALSAIALGKALQIYNGFYHPVAIYWLTGALVLCVLGMIGHRMSAITSVRSPLPVLSIILTAGIAWQIVELLRAPSPGMYLRDDAWMWVFYAGVVLQGALTCAGLVKWR